MGGRSLQPWGLWVCVGVKSSLTEKGIEGELPAGASLVNSRTLGDRTGSPYMPAAPKASDTRQTLGQAGLLSVAASPTLEVSDACSYYLEAEAESEDPTPNPGDLSGLNRLAENPALRAVGVLWLPGWTGGRLSFPGGVAVRPSSGRVAVRPSPGLFSSSVPPPLGLKHTLPSSAA